MSCEGELAMFAVHSRLYFLFPAMAYVEENCFRYGEEEPLVAIKEFVSTLSDEPEGDISKSLDVERERLALQLVKNTGFLDQLYEVGHTVSGWDLNYGSYLSDEYLGWPPKGSSVEFYGKYDARVQVYSDLAEEFIKRKSNRSR